MIVEFQIDEGTCSSRICAIGAYESSISSFGSLKSKADLQSKKANFIAKAEAVKTIAEENESSFKKSISQKNELLKADAKAKTEALKTKIEEKKHEFNVEVAEADYYDAVDYAESSIEWAIVALAEVEEATLEAFAAKLKLDDLKKANP